MCCYVNRSFAVGAGIAAGLTSRGSLARWDSLRTGPLAKSGSPEQENNSNAQCEQEH